MLTRLQHFFHDWSESFKIYYLSYLVALIAAVVWIIIISYDNSYAIISNTLYELLATCAIAFPLFLLGPLYNQTRNKSDYILVVVGSIMGIILSLLFAWYVSYYNVFSHEVDVQSHIIVVLLSYLIAWGSVLATVAYAHPRDNLITRGRWKELCVHVVIAGLGSAILRGGISASLGSIDYLFDVNIDYKRYMYLGVISFLIIGVSIFLTNLHRTKYEESYHSFFRFFGLYIFFPLAIVYACILLVYGGKIVITQTRPKGLISMMVIGYTIWGLVAYLLTYPLKESSTVRKMRSTYFISILVFVLLLFGAIGIRISQYGITESRYLIVMIGIWIVVTGVTSLIRPKKTFSTMIFTLLGLAISSAYLPRGAGPVALHSQKNRMESLLEKNGFYENGKIISKDTNVEDLNEEQIKDIYQASQIGKYLTRSYGLETMTNYYTDYEYIDPNNSRFDPDTFFHQLGITGDTSKIYRYDNSSLLEPEQSSYFSYYVDENTSVTNISGYRYSVLVSAGSQQTNDVASVTTGDTITLSFTGGKKEILTVKEGTEALFTININDIAQIIYQKSLEQPAKSYKIDNEKYSMIIKNANGEKKNDTIFLNYITFDLLIK